MNVGITGSNGVLGRIAQEKLAQLGIAFDCFCGDLRSKEDINFWVNNASFDAILHLAAIVPTSVVNGSPLLAFEVNVGGTINLLSALTSRACTNKIWFFYASTSHVYKSSSEPISEEGVISPISLYGKTKLMAEGVVTEIGNTPDYNIDVCVGRMFSFFHKTQKMPFLYPTILKRLEEENLEKPFFLYGADSVRDFLNAEEVVDKIVLLLNKQPTGVLNIASGQGIKIRDFVQSLTNHQLNIITDSKQEFLIADVAKFNKILDK